MRIILKSVDTLLNRIPITLKELCSQFMIDNQPLQFDAKINIEELEEFGFNYLHIKENEFEFELNTSKDYLSVDIETLNEMNNDVSEFQKKYNDDYIDQAIHSYGEFNELSEKLKEYYRKNNRGKNSFGQVVEQISRFYTLNPDDYDIICIEGSMWIYDELTK